MKYGWKIALAIVGVGLLLGAATVVAWGLTPLGPDDAALAALLSDGNVTVRDDGSVIVFVPAATDPVTGFILYPGGHVDHRSYAPVAREIARQGYLVAVVAMPLSLAVLGVDRADAVIAAHPSVRTWAIGGHSLGGSMAASYARTRPGRVRGLALWAAYPAPGDDLSTSGLEGLSTYGSNDGVLDLERFNVSVPLLPEGAVVEVIEGGNHAQFGNYGPQPGDGIAGISADEQQARAANLTVALLRAAEPAEGRASESKD